MYLLNLAAIYEFDHSEEIKTAHSSSEKLYEYKLNIAAAIAALKKNVAEILVTDSNAERKMLFKVITRRLMKAVVPICANRHSERKRKHKSMKYSQNRKRTC